MPAALIVHIGAGVLGILSGAIALAAAKGGCLHRVSGTIFFAAMLLMSAMGSFLAVHLSQRGNVMGGAFAFYLVATAWITVKRPQGTTGAFEICAMLLGFAVAAMGVSFGLQAASSATGELDGTPPPMFYVFASLAAFGAALDLKTVVRGGIAGTSRIARHIWRMCASLFIATGSFFLGQQKVMPAYMHGSNVLLALAVAPLVIMVIWLVRIRISRRFARAMA